MMDEIKGKYQGHIIWFGDFNAHNTLWGSRKGIKHEQKFNEYKEWWANS